MDCKYHKCLFSGGVKLEKEITNDESPEAVIFTPSENIKTEMFKQESVYQPEIQFTTSNEVKLEADNNPPTFWSVSTNIATSWNPLSVSSFLILTLPETRYIVAYMYNPLCKTYICYTL